MNAFIFFLDSNFAFVGLIRFGADGGNGIPPMKLAILLISEGGGGGGAEGTFGGALGGALGAPATGYAFGATALGGRIGACTPGGRPGITGGTAYNYLCNSPI